MKRPVLTWMIFSASLIVALGVMLFFTVEMLAFERSMARAQAQAALEETVRLALWRMDSTAAILLHQKSELPEFTNKANAIPQQNVAQRFEPQAQQAISSNEMQLRQSLEQAPSLDWHKIAPVLLDRISDILPGAILEDTTAQTRSPTDTRLLATIPARLIVPASALPDSSLPWNTPARISLMIAWGCVLLAAGALARLLAATMSLSSRRGAFASAVTHELRTPLTTFRMYAEMLASGMVDEEAKRRQYLDTLVAEADRLGHLIENVLAYSRLENRMAPRRAMAEMTVQQLIQNALPALQRRVDQAGLSLNVHIADPTVLCRTDPVAVGQILINLIDNACKYGLAAIELCARGAGDKPEIRVTDHGPGIAPDRVGRLFWAFSKSRTDSIPGNRPGPLRLTSIGTRSWRRFATFTLRRRYYVCSDFAVRRPKHLIEFRQIRSKQTASRRVFLARQQRQSFEERFMPLLNAAPTTVPAPPAMIQAMTPTTAPEVHSINPGAVWNDDRNQEIQAHGGDVIRVGDMFYWFGEDRSMQNLRDHKYVACYASTDLIHWTFRKQVVAATKPEGIETFGWVLERPKVYFNAGTGKFIMYAPRR